MSLQVLVSGSWLDVPDDIFPRNIETRNRWIAVLKVAREVGETPFRNNKITKRYNERYGTKATTSAIKSVLDRVKKKVVTWYEVNSLGNTALHELTASPELTADEALVMYRDFIGLSQKIAAAEPESTWSSRLVFILADLHGSPVDSLLPAMVAVSKRPEYKDMSFFTVYAGDVFDMFNTAHAGKVNEVPVGAAEFGQKEYQLESALLTGFVGNAVYEFPGRHVMVTGNHDLMTPKYLPKGIPYWIRRTFIREPLELLVAPFDGSVELGSWNVDYHMPDGEVLTHYKDVPEAYVLGDLLVSHMNFSGRVPGSAVQGLYSWWQNNRIQFGLEKIRVLVQAHAHNLYCGDTAGGHVVLIEPGYLGDMRKLKYKVGYNAWGESGAPRGFVTCVQHEQSQDVWKTDLKTIQLHRI